MTLTRDVDTLRLARRDPVWFCRETLGFEPWSRQRDILHAVRDYDAVAVRSGHGVGKTTVAAAAILWFLYSYPHSRVISTAPTWPQVEHLLWRELAHLYRKAPYQLGGTLLNARLDVKGDDWFALGLSTDKPERFQGHHARGGILYVYDEASGVDERIFEAGEGGLTGRRAKKLLIGNPTQPAGTFYDAFHSRRSEYATIHVSSEESPNLTGEQVTPAASAALVSREWVETRRRMWGADSPIYQVRVRGDFASQGDDSVTPLGELEAAQARTVEPSDPVIVSCDVARFGSDDTVIAIRKGRWVRIVESYNGRDTMQTAGHIKRVADDAGAAKVVVDDVGVGGGVVDRLREQRPSYAVESFGGGEKARDGEHYPNRRSEAWFSFAEQLPTIDLDADEQLAADLLAPRYKTDSAGRLVVEQKSETKRRLGRSPDRADAVLMAFSVSTDVASVVVPSRRLQTRIVSGGSGW